MLTENDIIEYAVLARVKTHEGADDWFQAVLTKEQHDGVKDIVLSGRSIKLHERSIADKAYAQLVNEMVGG